MRPLYLEISAFGPYKNLIQLPLENLGDSGIYLITGPTGAGKTTIFDAISFAFFGEASGNIRESKMLRCKEADSTTKTYVKLKFLLRDKIYEIARNPKYERPSKRSSTGFTTEPPNASLTMPNGDIIDGLRPVNEKIMEIVGLDRSQFSKIAMIAQGDFMKLLLADTNERRDIFRKIFSTSVYSYIQQKIKDDTIKTRSKINELNSFFERECDSLQDFTNLTPQEIVENVENIINELKQDELITNQKFEKIMEEFTNISTLQEKSITKNNLIFQIQQQEQTKKLLILTENKLKLKEKSVPFLNEKHRDLLSKIAKGNNELPLYKEFDLLEANLLKEQKSFIKLRNDMNLIGTKLNLANQQIERGEAFIVQNNGIEITLQQNQNTLEKLNEATVQIKNLQTLEDNLKKEEKSYKSNILQYKDIEKNYKKQIELEKNSEILFFSSLAGILAENLQENTPCPVCGATNHPILAKRPPQTPTEDELNKIRKTTQSMQKNLEQKSILCATQKTKANELQNQLIQGKNSLNITTTLQNKLEDTQALSTKITEEVQNLSATLEKRKQAEKLLVDIKLEITNLEKNKLDLNAKKATCEATGKAIREERDRLHKKLQWQNLAQAQAHINKLQTQLEKLDKAKANLETACNKNKTDLSSIISALKILNEQIEQIGEIPEDLIEKFPEVSTKKEAILKEKQTVYSKKEKYIAGYKNLKELLSQIIIQEEKGKWLQSLDNTASGNIRSKQKLNFETFVQISYFNMVIHAANQRFTQMTQGRYELRRREEVDNFMQQTGLELDVFDSFSGSLRSVKTLSGGESFKASLCLALGLSDVISAHSGGIKIDSLFVDEGFGSLDSESLDLAIKILSNLSQDGKLIGIISHVNALRDTVEKKIIVSPKGESVITSV